MHKYNAALGGITPHELLELETALAHNMCSRQLGEHTIIELMEMFMELKVVLVHKDRVNGFERKGFTSDSGFSWSPYMISFLASFGMYPEEWL